MDWLRLWHDMPNDPKWRTIARQSKQSVALVQALYLHLLVAASTNVTRGNADVTTEDLASALDATDEEIEFILEAMQGRVLEGRSVTGWEKRQPKRHDDSGERVRKYREKSKESKAKEGFDNSNGNAAASNESQCNAPVTQCNAPEEIRLDTDTDLKNKGSDEPAHKKDSPSKRFTEAEFEEFWEICRNNWHGVAGTKAEAKKEFLKLDRSNEILSEISRLTLVECQSRKRRHESEGFAENMKHVCRWIKYRGWEAVADRPRATSSKIDQMWKNIGVCS